MNDYPNDADGDTLRRIANDGVDMTKPLMVEFHVSVPDAEEAQKIERLIGNVGFCCKRNYDDIDNEWLVICSKEMVPSYENVVSTQKMLAELVSAQDAQLAGWGALG